MLVGALALPFIIVSWILRLAYEILAEGVADATRPR